MVGNVEPRQELPCFPPFADFLASELVPWMRETFRAGATADRTVVSGASLGGLAASFAAFQHPEVFGNVAVAVRARTGGAGAGRGAGMADAPFCRGCCRGVRLSMSVGAMEISRAAGHQPASSRCADRAGLRGGLHRIQRQPQLSQLENRLGPPPRASARPAEDDGSVVGYESGIGSGIGSLTCANPSLPSLPPSRSDSARGLCPGGSGRAVRGRIREAMDDAANAVGRARPAGHLLQPDHHAVRAAGQRRRQGVLHARGSGGAREARAGTERRRGPDAKARAATSSAPTTTSGGIAAPR